MHIDSVKDLLRYDPHTGIFTWAKRRIGTRFGVEAGCFKDGYRVIRINGKLVRAHRLAFLYMTGSWPKHHIDHINGDRSDNRWINLREVDFQTNNENQRKAKSNSKSGILGVMRHQGRWMAQIQVDGKSKYIGMYGTPEEAHEAYLKAKRELHQGCTI